ncbi:MAG: PD-(D/E)XK nuclease family protein [Clostridia bacterium]|nr:PD-(D/E)XK nuclease family protein [Clostridia bacterium]
MRLTGRIDRVDTFFSAQRGETLVRIIDYKSGAKAFDIGEVYAGLNLQLAVYLSAICTPENASIVGENPAPAGLLYFRISDPVTDVLPTESEAVKSKNYSKAFRLKGLVRSDMDIMEAMDEKNGKDILPAGTATGEQFAVLSSHVKTTVQRLVREMEKGNIAIHPYKTAQETACTYCPYTAFCAHDGRHYHQLKKQSAAEVWAAMEAVENES